MSWLNRLLPGSYFGIPFGIESHKFTGGRRVQQHEYPGRDRPFAEDLGRRARGFTVEAWIVGDNYDINRTALIVALERGGTAPLVHPYVGVHLVKCERFEVSERSTEGRMCRVTMTLIEAGSSIFPLNAIDVGHALADFVEGAIGEQVSQFLSGFGV